MRAICFADAVCNCDSHSHTKFNSNSYVDLDLAAEGYADSAASPYPGTAPVA